MSGFLDARLIPYSEKWKPYEVITLICLGSIDTVTNGNNWLKRLEKSENKSRSLSSGKSLRLSSIDGWTEDKLPKLLIVWNFEKTSTDAFPSLTRPGKFSKKRDIEAIVDSYDMYLITDEDASVVPWEYEINHANLCLLYTSPSPRDATLSRMPSSA